jgi:phage shock protein A
MLRRLVQLFRGWFGQSVSTLEKRNPGALLELEKAQLRKQIANYNQGLASHAALCERLMSQVRNLETEERQLRASTTAQIRAGNRSAAAESALRLQTARSQLAENRKQMEQAETTYKELLRAREVSVRAAQEKLEKLKQNIDDLKVRRATAEMTEMTAAMSAKLGSSGDTMERLAKMVDEERQLAAGRTRVARDSMPAGAAALKENEHRALAEQALADFAAEENIALETRVLPYDTSQSGG